MSWSVIITANAKKDLKKLPKLVFFEISGIIDQLKADPFDLSDLVRLSDKGKTWRIRKGSYRIKFELFQKEKAIFIFEVKRRTTITY